MDKPVASSVESKDDSHTLQKVVKIEGETSMHDNEVENIRQEQEHKAECLDNTKVQSTGITLDAANSTKGTNPKIAVDSMENTEPPNQRVVVHIANNTEALNPEVAIDSTYNTGASIPAIAVDAINHTTTAKEGHGTENALDGLKITNDVSNITEDTNRDKQVPANGKRVFTNADIEEAHQLMLNEITQDAKTRFPSPPSFRPFESANDDSETHTGKKMKRNKQAKLSLYDQPFDELDNDGREAQAEFKRKATKFYKKVQFGMETEADKVAYERLLRCERSRRNKVDLDRKLENQENEESLFVPMDEYNNDITAGKAVSSSFSMQKRKRDTNDDGYSSEIIFVGENSRQESITVDGANPSQKSAENNLLNVLKAKSHKSAHSKRPKHKGPRMTNIASLIKTDIFTDAVPLQEGERDAERLRLRGRNRANALKDLIASLPDSQISIAKIDEQALNKAAKNFIGRGSCSVYEGDSDSTGQWLIRGMKTPLKHFQMLGASWMKSRETSEEEPHGGLCCDDMGLGKTLMTLATIINGMPAKEEPIRSTLIIVPSSLLKQWYEEIHKHCNDKLTKGEVITFAGKMNPLNCNNIEEVLQKRTIILTTHTAIRQSCKKVVFPTYCQTQEEKEQWFEENREEFRDIFHRVEFYRVVVDEAHVIKNHLSQTSLAIREIKARYRWALTGTPLHNSPNELYPYMKFLQIPQTGNYRIFSHNYNGPKGSERLAVMLDKIMLRRTYSDRLMGDAIVKLPPAHRKEQWLSFNGIERAVYDICRDRTIQSLRADAKNNQLNLNLLYARINRLRQMTSHIFLILESISTILTPEDYEKLEKITKHTENPNMDALRHYQIRQLREILAIRQRQQGENGLDSIGLDDEAAAIDGRDTGGRHGLSFQFNKFLMTMKKRSGEKDVTGMLRCSACGLLPAKDPYITSCHHIYCENCLTFLSESAAFADESSATCLACNVKFLHSEKYDEESMRRRKSSAKLGLGIFDAEEDNDDSNSNENESGKKKKNDRWAWIKSQPVDILPSAKTTAVKAQILNWIDENPKVKVIVFTQWIGMSHILDKVCDAEGWQSFPFNGSISLEQRQVSIDGFRDHPGPCILISTLKYGGVGLNLTMASKAIMVDAWWNEAIENQAFGRIFRIGQDKNTSLTRLFVTNTIDEKIYQMQQDKNARIGEVMERGGNPDSDSVEELLGLFGNSDQTTEFIVVNKDRPKQEPIFDDDAYMEWDQIKKK